MSAYIVIALCIQVCLIQSVMSQTCGFPYPGSPSLSGVDSTSLNQPQSQPQSSVSVSRNAGSYGGTGTGQVGVSGDIGASGQTVVVGSVPVLGSVEFSGTVPASGSVSISGQCGCGCN